MAHLRLTWSLFAVVAVSALGPAPCPPSFADATLAGWPSPVLPSVPAANAWSSNALAAGGNGGACREVVQSINGGVVGGAIFLAHLEPTAHALPPTGLGRVDLSYEARMLSETPVGAFGGVVAVMCCVEQGGVVYYAPTSYTLIFLNTGWQARSASGLTANHFEAPGPQPGPSVIHPNFATGGPVRFGLTTANGNGGGGFFPGGNVATTSIRFDNFAVSFSPAAGVTTTVPGCGAASPPTLTATAPAFGSTVTITLTGATPLAASALVWGAPVPAFTLGAGPCQTAMDLNTLFIFASFTTDEIGRAHV